MSVLGIFSALDISASGMRAQRLRQNAISSNLANVETTRTAEGGPYRRQFVVIEAESNKNNIKLLNQEKELTGTQTAKAHLPMPSMQAEYDRRFFGNGVRVVEIREDERPPKLVYNPGHPDADIKGYVQMPNVNPIEEMVDMISASRAYEANVTAFNATKNMMMQALQM